MTDATLVSPDARREGTVRVGDGRAIGFAEWGDPGGLPVAVFHGGPGSRRMGFACEAVALELGVRLVCLERPGFGLSDRAPDRTLVGWVDDVADAARVLEIERPVVAGVSAGAPYALACGARSSPPVRLVAVIAGVVPPEQRPDDQFPDLVRRDPTGAESAARRHFDAMAADVDASVAAMAAGTGPDRAVYARPEVQERFRQTRREAFRSGVEGAVHDLVLAHRPWGFALDEIAVPVRWWHGSLDPVVPLPLARAAAARIRDVDLVTYENEGHAIGFTHGAEILRALVAAS